MGAAPNYTFTNVTDNHTIAVTFAINTYTLTPSVPTHGKIDPADPVTVNWGTSQTFSFTPGPRLPRGRRQGGRHLSGGAAPSYTFTNVTANHTIAVTFAINTYTLTPSVPTHGKIDPPAR